MNESDRSDEAIECIETPAALVDRRVATRNIARYQGYCDEHGLALRPHVKTHKLPLIAREQLDAGATGITCQKLSEAAVMADAGIDDILITYNVIGDAKLARLRALAGRVARLSVVADARAGVDRAGLACPHVSSGGSPDMWHAHEVPGVTEIRIGTYVYNDRSLVAGGTCTLEDCALRVITTVVSTPAPGRAVIDAGSKALTSDLIGLDHYGHVTGHDEVRVESLSEEHGVLRWDDGTERFAVGERLAIVPNHVCPVSNLFDTLWMTADGVSAERVAVAARGAVT